MFKGKLYRDAIDEEPARLFVLDETLGRRVAVELEMRGPYVVAVPLDVPVYEEPPLPEQPRTSSPDARQSPIDGDDFTTPSPAPVGAAPRA